MTHGATLLELLVVIAVMGILAGTAAVSHQAMRPGLDLSMASRQVVMDLRAARTRAIAENVGQRVVFPAAATAYQAQRKSGGAYVNAGGPIALPRGIAILDCTAADHGIGFKPRGNAATFGTVILRNTRGDERRVVVDIAGQMRVQ